MGRRKHVVQWIPKGIRLPPDLLAEVELALYSEALGGVPYGAFNNLIAQLLRDHLAKVRAPKPVDESLA